MKGLPRPDDPTPRTTKPADFGNYGGLMNPPGLAQRGHLSHHETAAAARGGGQQRFAPLNELAGQRQPRQGAPPAVADQAEVRPQAVVGRPL